MTENIKKILVVDDEPINIDILVDLLDDDYTILVALDGESAIEILLDEKVDLVLLDIIMPGMDGYEVCEKLQASDKTRDIPIIFITAQTDEEAIEKAYNIGCIDFISKPFIPNELIAKVNRELKMQEVIANLEASQIELKRLSSIDPLTKLYNRRFFTKTSEHFFNLAMRNKSSLSIIMLDIDNFKLINDTYGHQVGDEVLVYLASMLVASRKSDIVCRFGGEEFIILLPDTDIDGTLLIAEKLRQNIGSNLIKLEDNRELKFTASFGIAEIDHSLDKNIEKIIYRADKAMYEAKETDKNKVCS